MKTGKNDLRLLVIVPHRDARLPLRAWSSSLFAAGVPGAYSFPWVTPLAQLGRSLSTEELKSLARALRRHISGSGGMFSGGAPASAALSADCNGEAWGPVLNTELPADFFEAVSDAVVRRISPLVLGSALVHEPLPANLPSPPPGKAAVSFRAAALANMDCCLQTFDKGGDRPLDGFSFEWKIGKLHWLPKR